MKYLIHNKDYSNEVNSLMDFAQKRMGFSNKPRVLFSDDPNNASKPLGKTAYYDPNNAKITIFVTSRHVKDILRSLAHELVHHMQNEQGSLHDDGYMGVGYAQKNPKMREMERQAYEMGNLCFRDWEDSLKQKHPTIYNERRNHKMSLKDWKNKELMENLFQKWGIKSKLNENVDLTEDEAVEVDITDADTEDMPQVDEYRQMMSPPMPPNPEGLPMQEEKEYDLEENADRMFAPSHYCAHHVVHEGKEGYTVDHNYNKRLGKVTRYDVKFKDGSIIRNIHESKLTVLEGKDHSGKRDDGHPPAKRDKEETMSEEEKKHSTFTQALRAYMKANPNATDEEFEEEHKKLQDAYGVKRGSGPFGRTMEEAKEELAVQDGPGTGKDNMGITKSGKMVPNPGGDGKKSKKSKDKPKEKGKEKKGKEKFKPKKGEVPPQFKKKGKMKESIDRRIRVNIKK